MIKITIYCLLLLLFVQSAFAASFDCAKAGTKVEKLICSNPDVSRLDEDLNMGYKQILDASSPEEKKEIIQEQRKWLKEVRNQCADKDCLWNAYYKRINEISEFDPFADKNITCGEMKKYPERIFQNGYIDLGSGRGSPIEVNYKCTESLVSLPFLQKIYELTEKIRNERSTQCTGTIVYAQWRYYHFRLAEAGFAPNVFLKKSLESQEKNYSPAWLFSNQLKYFEHWSWESPYNFMLHKEYMHEFNKALSLLAKHYQSNFNLSEEQATITAEHALMIFVGRAAGSFPSYYIEDRLNKRPAIVDLVRNKNSTLHDLDEELTKFPRDESSKIKAYFALKVSLYLNKGNEFVSRLLEYIGTLDDLAFNTEGEPVLFAALIHPQYVQPLLEHGASVDVTNGFGKTPLYYAIQMGDHELANQLIKSGANVNHTYKTAKELNPYNDRCFPLRHTKRTPLMHAAANSDVEMIKLLLKHGARLNDLDELSFTALDYSIDAKEKANEKYIQSTGGKLGNPIYPYNSSNQPMPISKPLESSSLIVNGYVKRLKISSQRPNVLVASVIPWDTNVPNENNGLYLFSLDNPKQPRKLAVFPSINPYDLALSPDGKTAYVIQLGFNNAPPGKYGLLVIDISNPEKPQLAKFVEGDFMTMHLSHDGEHLYLQERKLAGSSSRGTVVLSTDKQSPKILCNNPYADTEYNRPPFAYGFSTFSDENLLIIREQQGGIYLYDVSSQCEPKELFHAFDRNIGTEFVAIDNRTIIIKENGLSSYRLKEEPQKLSSWRGQLGYFSINDEKQLLSAIFNTNEVVVITVNTNGEFTPEVRYKFEDQLGSTVLSNDAWLYSGTNGKLLAVKTSLP